MRGQVPVGFGLWALDTLNPTRIGAVLGPALKT